MLSSSPAGRSVGKSAAGGTGLASILTKMAEQETILTELEARIGTQSEEQRMTRQQLVELK
jgi:hypothetical protein